MLERLFIFIQYLGCLPLKSVSIVFKDEAFPDFWITEFYFRIIFDFLDFPESKDKKMPGIIEQKYLIKFKAHGKRFLYINITIHSKIYKTFYQAVFTLF